MPYPVDSDVLYLVWKKLEAECCDADKQREALQGNSSADATRQRVLAKIAKEPSIRLYVDQYCREWSEGKPRTVTFDAENAVFVWDRMIFACGFAQWLYEHGFRVAGKAEHEITELLLIDYWHLLGPAFWKERVNNMP